MAISVKKALEKYGVTANAFNATQETIMREGAKAVTNAAAVLAVFETWQTAIKEDKNGGDGKDDKSGGDGKDDKSGGDGKDEQ